MSHEPDYHHNQAADSLKPLPPKGIAKMLAKLIFVCLGVLVVLNIFIQAPHPHFDLEKLPGFWALFGLVLAVILGKLAKGTAHTFLGKDEDYYQKPQV